MLRYVTMRNICIFIYSLLISSAVLATTDSLYHFKIADSEGNISKISIHPYINQTGTFEVRIDAAGIPRLFDKLNPTIAYGRDLNHNNKIDTWFFLTETGISVIEKEGSDTYGRDILGQLVNNQFKTSSKAYLSSATTTALSYLFFTADEIKSSGEEFYYDWINLEELNLAITKEEKDHKLGMSYEQMMANRELVSIGFKDLADQMEKLQNRDLYGYLALDVGAWLTGGVIIKWGGKLLATPLKMLSETTFVKYLSENLSKYVGAQQEKLALKFNQIKESFNNSKSKEKLVVVKTVISKNIWRSQLKMSLKAIQIKNKLLGFSMNIFKGVRNEWKYIALNASIQTAAEGYARFDEIDDENPLVMANNLFTNKEFQQNIGFMTMDTVLMTGVSRSLKTTKAKFMACGMIAMTNSSIINFVVKKEENYQRVAMDTSWEAIIGNSQVQMDLAALTFFEKLSKKKNNPKLQLLGYAFVLVDQAVGYYSYSRASDAVNSIGEARPVLVPILAENP